MSYLRIEISIAFLVFYCFFCFFKIIIKPKYLVNGNL